METWEDIQGKKAQLLKDSVAELDQGERDILSKALALEWENRNLRPSEFSKQLRNFIQQVVQ